MSIIQFWASNCSQQIIKRRKTQKKRFQVMNGIVTGCVHTNAKCFGVCTMQFLNELHQKIHKPDICFLFLTLQQMLHANHKAESEDSETLLRHPII
jgi:hypothetical protein